MLSGLFIILLPLVVGYLVPLRQPSALKLINRMLSWIVYVILFFMGISLAFLDNLASNLLAILHYAAVSVVSIGRRNYLRAWPWPWNRCSCAAWSCSVFCSA